MNPPTPSECANCGATIPPNTRACPECGADERTGWREKSVYDNLDLPDSAWSDDSRSKNETENANRRVNGIAWYWWCLGVLLLLLFGLGFVRL